MEFKVCVIRNADGNYRKILSILTFAKGDYFVLF
jgi:hypothetical protein